MNLDKPDIRTALAAVEFWRSVYRFSRVPVPPTVDRLAERLTTMMSANGREAVAPQPHWITTEELATRRRISQRQARRIAKRIGQKVGGRWWIPEENV